MRRAGLPARGPSSADLANGRGSDLRLLGADLNLALGPWSLSNKMGFTTGHMPTNALFNNFAPETLGSFIAGEIAGANASPAAMAATGGAPFLTGNASYVAGGGTVSPGTEIGLTRLLDRREEHPGLHRRSALQPRRSLPATRRP